MTHPERIYQTETTEHTEQEETQVKRSGFFGEGFYKNKVGSFIIGFVLGILAGICAFVGLSSSGLQSLFSWSLFVGIGFILLYNSGRRNYYIYYGGLAGLIVIFLTIGIT